MRIVLSVLFLYCLSFPLFANTLTLYSHTYVRSPGEVTPVTDVFTAPPMKTVTLRIYNGGLQNDTAKYVSSSVITLNGIEIVGPNSFNQTVKTINLPVTVINNNNFSVELHSKPGGTISVVIEGEPLDTTPPTINASFSPPYDQGVWHHQDVTVSFTCSDLESGIASCTSPVTVSTEGADQVIAGEAVDNAGNRATASVSLNIDKTIPVVNISSPTNNSVITSDVNTVSITGAIVENNLYAFGINDKLVSINSDGSFSTTVTLEPGLNTFTAQAIDMAGNIGQSVLNITYTPPGPSLTIETPTDGVSINKNHIVVSGSVNNYSNLGVAVNNVVATVINNKFYANIDLIPGDNTITAVASAPTGTPYTQSIHVNETLTSQYGITLRHSVGVSPHQAQFEISGLSAWHANIDFGDGSNKTDLYHRETNPDSIIQDHTYNNPGVYHCTVTITEFYNKYNVLEESEYIIVVYSKQEIDKLVKNIWEGIRSNLSQGNIETALNGFSPGIRDKYRDVLNNIATALPTMFSTFPPIHASSLHGDSAEYFTILPHDSVNYGYYIYFRREPNGVWYLSGM